MHLSHGRIYLHVFSSSKFFKSTEFFRCYSTSFEVWNFLKTCFWIAFNVFVIFHKLPYSQPNLFLFNFDANFLRYGFFFDKWVSFSRQRVPMPWFMSSIATISWKKKNTKPTTTLIKKMSDCRANWYHWRYSQGTL